MRFPSFILYVPLIASFAGLMRYSSPVPLALSLGLLLSSIAIAIIPPLRRIRGSNGGVAVPLLITGVSLYALLSFHPGQEEVTQSVLGLPFCAGLSLLWWVSLDTVIRQSYREGRIPNLHFLIGILGGLLLLGSLNLSSSLTSPIEALSLNLLSAYPLAAFSVRALLPGRDAFKTLAFAIVPASILLAGLLFSAEIASDNIRLRLESSEALPEEAKLTRSEVSEEVSTTGGGASHRLPRNGNIQFSGRPLVFLKAHSAELFGMWKTSPLYVRTSSLAIFENDETVSPIRSGRWIYDYDDGVDDDVVTLKKLHGNRAFYTAYISRESVGHLPVLINTSTLNSSAVYEFADDWYQLTPPLEITRLRYSASVRLPSTVSRADDTVTGEVEIPSIYMDLPRTLLAARVSALTRKFDRADPLTAIRDYLRQNAEYSLKFSTPDRSSPVEEFLFGSRKGHCEHYAAATVMLLRSLGIPSRLAYGYTGGAADSRQRIIAFRDSDFHAWAEILVPGQSQWVVFDTTPEAPNSTSRVPATITLPAMDEKTYHNFSSTEDEVGFFSRPLGESVQILVMALPEHLIVAMVIALALAALLSRLLSRAPEDTGANRAALRLPEAKVSFHPHYLTEFEVTLGTLGLRRRPGNTWREFLSVLSDELSLPRNFSPAIDYFYSVSYAGKDRDPAQERHYLQQVRDWQACLKADR